MTSALVVMVVLWITRCTLAISISNTEMAFNTDVSGSDGDDGTFAVRNADVTSSIAQTSVKVPPTSIDKRNRSTFSFLAIYFNSRLDCRCTV